ncbi:hypothetical protein Cob_v004552 [Colletotrichum orbiculare MAFF 240422]|uniref:Uncharacterized protein n=1 Tax=Colletotrichum orbiculare (strain 104-T / ATCC 96160 / CBS 514.97 / LARS 414 / MAFF 240422) TaxID=1213857 RepID=A0A484FYC1_COLOR|nr:hypothetical protein Cob_v004552 [Colletotrichum orbiculare MAFF 240422]
MSRIESSDVEGVHAANGTATQHVGHIRKERHPGRRYAFVSTTTRDWRNDSVVIASNYFFVWLLFYCRQHFSGVIGYAGYRAHQAGNQDDLPLAVLVKAAHQSMDGESDKVYVYIQEIFREVFAIALSSEDDTGRTATRQVPRRKSAALAQQSQMHMR